MNTVMWQPSKHRLVSILSESHYSPTEFANALGSDSFMSMLKGMSPLALIGLRALTKAKVYKHVPRLNRRFAKECGKSIFSKRCWEIRSYTFTYLSQTIDGREIPMSGRVTFLHHKDNAVPHQVKTISLHTHQAFLYKDWAPSESLMFVPLKVLWDSAVIEPDLQKWGINFGIEAEGAGSCAHMARQLTDCVVAALEIMQQHGVSLAPDGYTTNWGTSQGASPALHFAKWYETEAPQWFKDTLRLKATFSAEGAVDLADLALFFYRHPELIVSSIALLLGYMKAFSPEQLGGYKPEEFAPKAYNDIRFQVDGREISLFEAFNLHYPELTAPYVQEMKSFAHVFAPDMLTADGEVDTDSPKVRAWLDCLRRHNDLSGWTPAHTVYQAHCPTDDVLPYSLAYDIYRTISNRGQNPLVHMLDVPAMRLVPHGDIKPHFVIAFVGQLLIALCENPDDMCRPYKETKLSHMREIQV